MKLLEWMMLLLEKYLEKKRQNMYRALANDYTKGEMGEWGSSRKEQVWEMREKWEVKEGRVVGVEILTLRKVIVYGDSNEKTWASDAKPLFYSIHKN